MITRLSQFVIFFIFTSIAENFQHEVDLRRCTNDDMFCFVKDSCMNKTGGIANKLVKYELNIDKLNNDTCDLIMLIKPFTKTKWLVMIKITSESENLKSESGIKFSHKDVLFECNPGTPVRKLNMTKFGDSTFTTAVMHCSVTIEGEKRFDDIFSDGDYANKHPELSYSTDQGDKTVTFGAKGDIFWNIPRVGTHSCDLTRLHSNDISEDYSQFGVDTTKLKLTCDSPNKLLILYKDIIRLAEEMHCDNKQFMYREINSANLTEIPDGVQVSVSCAVKFCSKCSNLPLMKCEDQSCVLPDFFEENYCKISKCRDGQKWRMDDGSLKDGEVECKKKNGIDGVGWFQTIDSNTKEITSASCSDKFICRLYSNLNVSCEAEHCKEASYSSNNQSIICTEDGYELNYNGNVLTNLTCNPNNGLYEFGDGHVERNGNVFCQKPLVEGAKSNAEASISPGAITGIAFGVIALIGLILVIIAFCVIRRRRSSPTTAPKSLNHSEGVKTAVYAYSRESSTAASEAPPSTERKEKSMPDSRDEKDKGEEKKEDKKESKKEEKTEEKKEEVKVEKKEAKDEKKIEKVQSQMPANKTAETGKKAIALDLTPEQIRLAKEPGDIVKQWDENTFQDLMKIVTILSVEHRLTFMRNLTAFNHYKGGINVECGTLMQFFLIVRRCQEKELDCPATWELINRLVKILCVHLPQKEGADVINRLRKMMREYGRMLLNAPTSKGNQGLANKDPVDMQIRRELAMRILLWIEDPECLEELRKMGGGKLEDVDIAMQTVVFSHALNRMGKKEELEKRLNKDSSQQDPKPKDRPFGTEKQHLVYALASTKDDAEMVTFLSKVADARAKSSPPAEFNPTDLLCAFKGATENPAHFEKVLKIYDEKADPLYDELVDEIVEKYAKTPAEKKKLENDLKADYMEICLLIAENCVTLNQWIKIYNTITSYLMYAFKPGSNAFDANKLMSRVVNLEAILKDKKCVEMVDEGLKRAGY